MKIKEFVDKTLDYCLVYKKVVLLFGCIVGFLFLLWWMMPKIRFHFPWTKTTEVQKTEQQKNQIFNEVKKNDIKIDSVQKEIQIQKVVIDTLDKKKIILIQKHETLKKELGDEKIKCVLSTLDSLGNLVF